MATPTYTKAGSKAATAATLDKKVFGLKVSNHQLLKDAYVAYLANGRVNLAVTKERGDVSGGGRKPWSQKGTGRARFGSSRNPIWRGGGVAFGPTGEENYRKGMSTAMRRQAIRQALSLAADAGSIMVIDEIATTGKTRDMRVLLTKLNVTTKVLIVADTKSEDLLRSTNNLAGVKLVQAKYLNVYDILNHDHIVLSKNALPIISEWLGTK